MGKLTFGCMVTFADWTRDFGTWGDVGVHFVLHRIAAAGFSRVYWRASDGCGQANYPSKVADPKAYWAPYDPQKYPMHVLGPAFKDLRPPEAWFNYYWDVEDREGDRWVVDFSQFDSVQIARDFSRKLGLEFYLWQEHAEDHGSCGQRGRMALRHPEWFTRNRAGQASRCRFSWAIEPAVQYRLAWVRELLEYEPDGIYFDLVKSAEGIAGIGSTPHHDELGVWDCTYDEPAVAAFKAATGRDPYQIPNDDDEWVRFRARYVTDFFRRVRSLQRSTYPNVKIGLFGAPTGRSGLTAGDRVQNLADPLRAFLEDHETLSGEEVIDEFVNAYADGVAGPAELQAMVADARSRIRQSCRYLGSQYEVYQNAGEQMIQGVEALAEAGCEHVAFFESTPLELNKSWETAYQVIKRFSS